MRQYYLPLFSNYFYSAEVRRMSIGMRHDGIATLLGIFFYLMEQPNAIGSYTHMGEMRYKTGKKNSTIKRVIQDFDLFVSPEGSDVFYSPYLRRALGMPADLTAAEKRLIARHQMHQITRETAMGKASKAKTSAPKSAKNNAEETGKKQGNGTKRTPKTHGNDTEVATSPSERADKQGDFDVSYIRNKDKNKHDDKHNDKIKHHHAAHDDEYYADNKKIYSSTASSNIEKKSASASDEEWNKRLIDACFADGNWVQAAARTTGLDLEFDKHMGQWAREWFVMQCTARQKRMVDIRDAGQYFNCMFQAHLSSHKRWEAYLAERRQDQSAIDTAERLKEQARNTVSPYEHRKGKLRFDSHWLRVPDDAEPQYHPDFFWSYRLNKWDHIVLFNRCLEDAACRKATGKPVMVSRKEFTAITGIVPTTSSPLTSMKKVS